MVGGKLPHIDKCLKFSICHVGYQGIGTLSEMTNVKLLWKLLSAVHLEEVGA